MEVDLYGQKLAITILCDLPLKFEHPIVAIDGVADDEKLALDFSISCPLQEERRMSDKGSSTKSNADSAMVERFENGRIGRAVCFCTQCKN